jgi:uncharacterized protein
MTINRKILNLLFAERPVNVRSTCHGFDHWMRVATNGYTLTLFETRADPVVVELFAFIHDCMRLNEDADLNHGSRAAGFVKQHWEQIPATQEQKMVLCKAVAGHTHATKTPRDPTLSVCWDADRLDLTRLGIVVDPDQLFTGAGKAMAVGELDSVVSGEAAVAYMEKISVSAG